jgi:hypothetical protein
MCPHEVIPPQFQVDFYRYSPAVILIEGRLYGTLVIQYYMHRVRVTQDELNVLRQVVIMELEEELHASAVFFG